MAMSLFNFIYRNIGPRQIVPDLADPCSGGALLLLGLSQDTFGGAIKVNRKSSCLITPWKPLDLGKNLEAGGVASPTGLLGEEETVGLQA